MSTTRQAGKRTFADWVRGTPPPEDPVPDYVRDAQGDGPIVRLANTILQRAVSERASDIYIEPGQRAGQAPINPITESSAVNDEIREGLRTHTMGMPEVRVRYRIDGVLHDAIQMPDFIRLPLTARYKHMANLNLLDQQLPQCGRFGFRYLEENYTARMHCLPTQHGENLVFRILSNKSDDLRLNRLALTPEVEEQLRRLVQAPYGLVLVAGPMGSGKTTMLYALLNFLRQSANKDMVAVEDVCEYPMDGVAQVSLSPQSGENLASLLQAVLRQGPEVLLIGAPLDEETLPLALTAAESGALVLASLGAQNAASALQRLPAYGVDPSRIAASTLGILAQHLVRKVCTDCKEVYEEEPAAIHRFGFRQESPAKVSLVRGKGCDACRQTGYRGRIGIYELLTMNVELSDLLIRRASPSELSEAARANGMHLLREDGLVKILEGYTTPEEIQRFVTN